MHDLSQSKVTLESFSWRIAETLFATENDDDDNDDKTKVQKEEREEEERGKPREDAGEEKVCVKEEKTETVQGETDSRAGQKTSIDLKAMGEDSIRNTD